MILRIYCRLRVLVSAVLALVVVPALAADNLTAPRDAATLAVWNFDKDADGWNAVRHCRCSVKDGVLRLISVGNDPRVATKVAGPAGWKELTIRAKFRGRVNGQVYWTTKARPGTSEKNSVRFDIRAGDGKFHDYKIYFNPDQDLTGLRFDPNNRKSQMLIAWIALANRKPPAPKATAVSAMKLLPGFKAELLYSVPSQEQGSWVSLALDDKGRLIASDQYGKLYRITPAPVGKGGETKIEKLKVDMGYSHGMLYAFESLYVMSNERIPGLYRLRDTNGDDQFDEVKLLRKISGAGEHGPHAVVLSPDRKHIYVCAGNHTNLPKMEKSLVPKNWDEDQLLTRMWDAGGHAVGKMAPGGWIARTDPDGNEFELVCSGFRNEFDIAFNNRGELFTYDADMEWDIGTPWYRPTRVNHVTSGAEFGWRSGTGKWPEWYPDSLPSVVDIGPGSPTGIVFGKGAKFPAKYQKALFIIDWSFGVIHAVHMEPDGSTYKGIAEPFVAAAPLPGTDILINPKDGAMYFTIGGRRTQSGLYRITYVGDEPTGAVRPWVDGGEDARELRHKLEALHHAGAPNAVETAWPYLSHADRHIRFAARIAIEHQPVAEWRDRALAEENPQASITVLIALARNGDSKLLAPIVKSIGRTNWDKLNAAQKLELLRVYSLTFARMGNPGGTVRDVVLKRLDPLYPSSSVRQNRELCQLLVYLEADGVSTRTMDLLNHAATQEEQLHYALCLRELKTGWSLEEREQYFNWFVQAAVHRGGHSFDGFLRNIRNEAIAKLTPMEKKALSETLKKAPTPTDPVAILETRKFVKKWTVDELVPSVEASKSGRNFDRGREMFAATACFKCHRFAGQGGIVGHDLTAVGRRLNSRNLLESLIEPSKVVSDQFQATTFVMEDGRTVIGRIANLSGKTVKVVTNMLDPGRMTDLNVDEIVEKIPSKVSMMPNGLLDTLTEDEILDLVAYLRSGGDRKHEVFK